MRRSSPSRRRSKRRSTASLVTVDELREMAKRGPIKAKDSGRILVPRPAGGFDEYRYQTTDAKVGK
jgi:hypothetical protein